MALLKPFPYTLTQRWGPSTLTSEPTMYAFLGRAWWPFSNGKSQVPWWPWFRKVLHFHPGLDLAAPEGTPIQASEAGTVTAAGFNPGSSVSGIRVQVAIRSGTLYGHGHLSRLGPGIAVGVHVKRGQVIGYVGHTGGATGPHSHFFVQSVVPFTHQSMLYDPALFLEGGANANDSRFKPL